MKYAYSKLVVDLGKQYGAYISSIEDKRRDFVGKEMLCVEVANDFNNSKIKWTKGSQKDPYK